MRSLFSIILLFLTYASWGQTNSDVAGYKPGYVLDVEYERSNRVEEFNIFSSPPEEPKKDYRSAIFDAELSREFKFNYEQQFGRSAAERNLINPGRFDEFFYETGVSVTLEEDRRRKRVFGEYMVKRLTEHHLDRYAKSRPSLKTVYELKDRLSKVNVETRGGFKFRLRYSLSGNFFQVKVKNPYNVDTRLFMQMDPASFGPTEVQETRLSFGFSPATTYRIQTDSFVEREGHRIVTSKSLAPGVTTSFTVSQFPEKQILGQREETLAIIGIAWSH